MAATGEAFFHCAHRVDARGMRRAGEQTVEFSGAATLDQTALFIQN
jgi:hypothetical protein